MADPQLEQIKKILLDIKNQGGPAGGGGAGEGASSRNLKNVQRYKEDLKLARDELALLEKGTGAYNRKQREVEKLTRKTRDAMKDARDEADIFALSTNTLTTAMSMMGNAIETVANAFAGLVKDIFDSAKALDNVTMQFRASTGASAAMAANIGELNDRLRMYGISTQEAASAVGEMYSNLTTFSRMSKEQQAELGRTVALLSEVGMSASTSVKIPQRHWVIAW
jgi:methyl-accepting chemotaxis protein